MNDYLLYGLGFLAQFLFFGRTILQWFKSENEGEVISPVLYWKISLVASMIMLFYGIFRNDFAIILGQALVYFVYARNLQLKKVWKRLHVVVRVIVIFAPFAITIWLLTGDSYSFKTIFGNQEIAPWLLLLGVAGQLIFTFRFIYQWIYSEKEKESLLPIGFWVISTLGALVIFVYAILRRDPVLFISNGLGLFVYVRNILLHSGRKSLFMAIGNQSLIRLSQWISEKIR